MNRELGTKYLCFKCGTKFYDLRKPAPVCPKCGADQRETPAPSGTSARRPRAKAPLEEVPEGEAIREGDDEALEEVDDEEEEEEVDDALGE